MRRRTSNIRMSNVVLREEFFRRGTLIVARELLGKHLVLKKGKNVLSAMITEVEAYDGPEDRASHAHRGLTPRNAPMFGRPGCWYVYLVYGMHWMLNIVTGEEGYPAAVLIRGACPEHPREAGDWSGPGKLTRAFGVDQRFNARASDPRTGLWIADRGVAISSAQIRRTPRIGVEYAGAWALRPFRFVLVDSECLDVGTSLTFERLNV